MSRLRLLLIVVMVAIFTPWPDVAMAQNGACPAGSILVGSPNGIYPSDSVVCAYNYNLVSMQDDTQARYPCQQYIRVSTANLLLEDDTKDVVIVPPGTLYYGDQLRIRFYLFYGNALLNPPETLEQSSIRLYYYNSSGIFVTGFQSSLTNYNYVSTYYEIAGVNFYYNVYFIDQVLNVGSPNTGGYLLTDLVVDEEFLQEGIVPSFNYASIQMGWSQDTLPGQCSIPNAQLPTTPTPGPTATGTLPATWTPVPGATSTPTPIGTPFPTSTGQAPAAATWTPTVITFPTIPAENTPTPWATYVIPTIALPTLRAWPTISWPSPDATIVAGSVATQEASAGALQTVQAGIESDWSTRVAQVEVWADPSQEIVSGTITGTTAYQSPAVMVSDMLQIITKPIGYVLGLQFLMPNAWPYIAFLIGIALFVLFNIFAKFALRVVVTIVEIVRRFWEAIPFN